MKQVHRDFIAIALERSGYTAKLSSIHGVVRAHFGGAVTAEEVAAEVSKQKRAHSASLRERLPELSQPPPPPNKSKILRQMLEYVRDISEELGGITERKITTELRNTGHSLVLCLSDIHFGEKVVLNGCETYNPEIAVNSVHSIFNQFIHVAQTVKDVDEVIILLAGDIVDGELIYATQNADSAANVFEQLDVAIRGIWPGIKTLAKKFPVRVYTAAGNHGRASKHHHPMSNFDNVLTYVMRLMASEHSMDQYNPIEIYAPHQLWTDFNIRGWGAHVRHIGVKQPITAGPGGRVRTWLDVHDADIIFYGHFHSPNLYTIGRKYVVANGSLAPMNEFSERLGFDEGLGQWMIATSDHEPVAFAKLLRPSI